MNKNISDFYVLAQGPKNGFHRFLISCLITKSDGTEIDLTGDNAIVFPDIIKDMSLQQRRNFVKAVAPILIEYKLNPKLLDDFN